jgi:putative Holliday junction resolvase
MCQTELMARLLAIDYGLKRTGIAVSDPLKIIASALDTVETEKLLNFLQAYIVREPVELFIVGMPRRLNNQPSEMAQVITEFIMKLKTAFPAIPVVEIDERNTSIQAQQALIAGGMKKNQRQIKGNIDKVSATLILQEYMSGFAGVKSSN